MRRVAKSVVASVESAVTITGLSAGGDGVARLADGRVVFVGATTVGDVVELKSPLEVSKKSFARGVAERIVTRGADRVAPLCQYAAECGGCDWQHIAYPAQLAAKETIVREALARIGNVGELNELMRPIIASPSEYGYRARARWIEAPGGGVGYRAEQSNAVVAVDACAVLVPAANDALRQLSDASRALARIDGAASVAASSSLRHAPPREWTVTVGGSSDGIREQDAEADDAMDHTAAPRLDLAVVHAADAAPRDAKAGDVRRRRAQRRPTFGISAATAVAHVDVLGETLRLSSASFLQANALLWSTLASVVLEECLLPTEGSEGKGEGVRSFVELYAGAGLLTLPLARRGLVGTAFECADAAIDDLERNLAVASLAESITVVRGRVERSRHANELADAMGSTDLLLLDPPRGGLHKRVARLVARHGPQRCVYVSCDPATLARDIKLLAGERSSGSGGAYAVAAVTPLDLFPQTHHVETVVRLERRV